MNNRERQEAWRRPAPRPAAAPPLAPSCGGLRRGAPRGRNDQFGASKENRRPFKVRAAKAGEVPLCACQWGILDDGNVLQRSRSDGEVSPWPRQASSARMRTRSTKGRPPFPGPGLRAGKTFSDGRSTSASPRSTPEWEEGRSGRPGLDSGNV